MKFFDYFRTPECRALVIGELKVIAVLYAVLFVISKIVEKNVDDTMDELEAEFARWSWDDYIAPGEVGYILNHPHPENLRPAAREFRELIEEEEG